MSTKSVTVARRSGWYGLFRKLRLFADGTEVAQLGRNQSIKLEGLAPDAVLRGRMDWGETQPFSLADVPDGATVTIKGLFTLDEGRNLGVNALPFRFEVEP